MWCVFLLFIIILLLCLSSRNDNFIDIARTNSEHERGLMFRDHLDENDGMLFVYPDEKIRNFWMKNTKIPLSVAFIDSNKKIIGIKDLVPYSTDIVSSEVPIKYALEMNRGWFHKT